MKTRSVAYILAISGWTMGCNSNDGEPYTGNNAGFVGVTSSGGEVSLGGTATGGVTGLLPGSGGTTNVGASATNASGGVPSVGGMTTAIAASGGTVTSTSGTGGQGGRASSVGGSVGKGGAAIGGASGGAGGSTTVNTGQSCSALSAATGALNLTIQVAGQERAYVLFVPTNYNATTAMPLIFAWHGLGGSGTMARQYFGLERAAGNQAIFVYPTGLTNADDKTAWTLTETGVDVQLFDALLANISSRYCIDTKRVYSTGHSYGAMMTNSLACYRSDVLRGIAPVAGMPPFGRPTCTGAVAAWIAHGENDATVDYTSGGIASRDFWINLNDCDSTATPTAADPSPCVQYQECSDGHPLHWCVHQDNHNWPSFAGAGIWAFFSNLK